MDELPQNILKTLELLKLDATRKAVFQNGGTEFRAWDRNGQLTYGDLIQQTTTEPFYLAPKKPPPETFGKAPPSIDTQRAEVRDAAQKTLAAIEKFEAEKNAWQQRKEELEEVEKKFAELVQARMTELDEQIEISKTEREEWQRKNTEEQENQRQRATQEQEELKQRATKEQEKWKEDAETQLREKLSQLTNMIKNTKTQAEREVWTERLKAAKSHSNKTYRTPGLVKTKTETIYKALGETKRALDRMLNTGQQSNFSSLALGVYDKLSDLRALDIQNESEKHLTEAWKKMAEQIQEALAITIDGRFKDFVDKIVWPMPEEEKEQEEIPSDHYKNVCHKVNKALDKMSKELNEQIKDHDKKLYDLHTELIRATASEADAKKESEALTKAYINLQNEEEKDANIKKQEEATRKKLEADEKKKEIQRQITLLSNRIKAPS